MWYINAHEVGFIEFKFIHFYLERKNDFFTIGYGSDVKNDTSRVLHLDGVTAPRSLTVNSSQVWATFTTDQGTSDNGYVIDIMFHLSYGMILYF